MPSARTTPTEWHKEEDEMLKQISIFAENSKGSMLKILSVLSRKNINILGSVTNDSAEYGIVRMVVSDYETAHKALCDAGYICSTSNVIGVELPDVPGSLEKLLGTLKDINVFVDYIYLTFNRDSGMPMIILHTDYEEEVEQSLVQRGYVCG